jgi:hypothetical protein
MKVQRYRQANSETESDPASPCRSGLGDRARRDRQLIINIALNVNPNPSPNTNYHSLQAQYNYNYSAGYGGLGLASRFTDVACTG